MRTLICAVLAGAVALSSDALAGGEHPSHEVHWDYRGDTGPAHWGDLTPAFTTCKTGTSQSPVDITGQMLGDLKPIQFTYSAEGLHVLNNGHTIQVQRTSSGSITVGGEEYDLLQLHFHRPSEHTVQAKAYPMEMHLVHKGKDGELAVVGVFLKDGAHNPHIEKIWETMPARAAEEKTAETKVNAADLLPEDRRYWHYAGSLTTPPCTEGVRWYVLKTPIGVSQEQVDRFSSVMHDNARPVQPMHERGMISSK